MKQKKAQTIRRSVALPRELLEAVQAHASTELRSNVNRLVVIALKEFVASRERQQDIVLKLSPSGQKSRRPMVD